MHDNHPLAKQSATIDVADLRERGFLVLREHFGKVLPTYRDSGILSAADAAKMTSHELGPDKTVSRSTWEAWEKSRRPWSVEQAGAVKAAFHLADDAFLALQEWWWSHWNGTQQASSTPLSRAANTVSP